MQTTLSDEVHALAGITDKPSLTALSYSLRHPETWPGDFTWDYSNCRTCAVGLALRLWPSLRLPATQQVQETWIAREMAMSHREAVKVFFGLAPWGYETVGKWPFRKSVEKRQWRAVKADDVADAIDAYLAKAA